MKENSYLEHENNEQVTRVRKHVFVRHKSTFFEDMSQKNKEILRAKRKLSKILDNELKSIKRDRLFG